MSAKKSRKSSPAPAAVSAPASIPITAAAAGAPATAPTEYVAWIDSTDPKKRKVGQVVLVAVWIYVAALWLLALDQWFHWGIFGPKVPPIP